MNKQITTCLWFNTQAEDAAGFYTSLFENSSIDGISRYGKEGFEVHGQEEGTVLTVAFQLNGTLFTALNGGPQYQMNPSISFYVRCQTEAEVDFLWKSLLKDKQKDFDIEADTRDLMGLMYWIRKEPIRENETRQ